MFGYAPSSSSDLGLVMSLRLVPVDSGKPIKLDKPVLLVGRNPDCDVILIDSRKVSRLHCLLAIVQNRVYIRDLGSTNGVWLNGSRVEREARMKIGDELSFADLKYELVNSSADPEPLPKAKSKRRQPDEDESENEFVSGEDLLNAPAFNERETRDPSPLRSKKKYAPDVGKDRLVPLPDEDDSFVVEPSLMRIPKRAPSLKSDDELPVDGKDSDGNVLLSLLADDDFEEPAPKKLNRPKSREEVRMLDEEDLLPESQPSKKKRRNDDSDDDAPALQLDFSDG